MPNYNHLVHMTRDLGMLQFSIRDIPNPESGYTLDDNARAAVLSLMLPRVIRQALLPCYLTFMKTAVCSPIVWHNVMQEDGSFEQTETASSDSRGRAFLAFCLIQEKIPESDPAPFLERLLSGILPVWETSSLRARSYILLGINTALPALNPQHPTYQKLYGMRNEIISSLMDAYEKIHTPSWRWYEDSLTYCNGILPHALLSCARLEPSHPALIAARDSLLFLCDTLFRDGYLNIIGNQGWFKKGQQRPPLFDQQPVDAASIALCCLEAFDRFGESVFLELAKKARDWFTGDNIHQLSLIDPQSGGCFDALTEHGVNENQGAESLLAWLLTFHALEKYSHETPR